MSITQPSPLTYLCQECQKVTLSFEEQPLAHLNIHFIGGRIHCSSEKDKKKSRASLIEIARHISNAVNGKLNGMEHGAPPELNQLISMHKTLKIITDFYMKKRSSGIIAFFRAFYYGIFCCATRPEVKVGRILSALESQINGKIKERASPSLTSSLTSQQKEYISMGMSVAGTIVLNDQSTPATPARPTVHVNLKSDNKHSPGQFPPIKLPQKPPKPPIVSNSAVTLRFDYEKEDAMKREAEVLNQKRALAQGLEFLNSMKDSVEMFVAAGPTNFQQIGYICPGAAEAVKLLDKCSPGAYAIFPIAAESGVFHIYQKVLRTEKDRKDHGELDQNPTYGNYFPGSSQHAIGRLKKEFFSESLNYFLSPEEQYKRIMSTPEEYWREMRAGKPIYTGHNLVQMTVGHQSHFIAYDKLLIHAVSNYCTKQ